MYMIVSQMLHEEIFSAFTIVLLDLKKKQQKFVSDMDFWAMLRCQNNFESSPNMGNPTWGQMQF